MPGPRSIAIVFEFKVAKIWKGPSYEYVYLQSASSEACGAAFSRGSEYLVYSADGTSAYLCGRTRLSSAQDHLDVLGDGKPPERGTRAPELPIMRTWLSGQEMIHQLERLVSKVKAELDPRLSPTTTDPAIGTQGASTIPNPDLQLSRIQRLARTLHRLLEERMSRPHTPTPEPTPTAVPTPKPVPATPTPQPTPPPVPTPATLAAAVTLGPTPIQAPQPVAVSEDSDTPEWLTPAVAGIAGVLVGVLGTTLLWRRRGGGT